MVKHSSPCGSKFQTNGNLKIHIQSVHEKIQFECNECNYKASKSALKLHVQTVHDGIKFDCDKCDHKYTPKVNLK